MIKVFWTTTKYYEGSKIIVFLISVPPYQFVIKSIKFLPGNKRRGSLRLKFLHPRFVELEIGIKLDGLPYFEITGKELVEWIGKVNPDQVASSDDIGWIMKVKKDYESVLDENKD